MLYTRLERSRQSLDEKHVLRYNNKVKGKNKNAI